MGDIFNEIVIFLEEYYVYVIGVGLILVLMLVGLLASRKKNKKANNDEEPMANINEVNTGSINDVPDTVHNDAMQPTNVVSFTEDKSLDTKNEPVVADKVDEQPVAPEVAPSPTPEPVVTPVNNGPVPTTPINNAATPSPEESPVMNLSDAEKPEVTPISNPTAPTDSVVSPIRTAPTTGGALSDDNIIKPIVEENKPLEEINPVAEERFDKTEVIDFSTATAEKPEDIKPVEAKPFIIDDSQFATTQETLNTKNDSDEIPKV